jgi:tRNA1Val (adenine37-N6)-methyltransferase
MATRAFRFKKFSVEQDGAAHLVGTDAVLLGAWADTSDCAHILDIGTGTGVVALMLAQRSTARLTAVEIHPASAALARVNFAASPWAGRLDLVESSVQDFSRNSAARFDLIVSNPPFFSETILSPDAARRLGRHNAALPPEDLLAVAGKHLTEKGRFCVILPVAEGRRLCELAVPAGLYCTEEVEVRSRAGKPVERLLLRFERDPYVFLRKQLVIYAAGTNYTDEFRCWSEAFYL